MKPQQTNQTVPGGENCTELSHDQEVIARLKASQEKSNAKFFAQGEIDGRKWSENWAEAIELKRLETALDSGYWDFEEEGSGNLFCLLVKPGMRGDQRGIADFWADVTGEREVPEPVYIQGFASGAMEVWNRVKDQI